MTNSLVRNHKSVSVASLLTGACFHFFFRPAMNAKLAALPSEPERLLKGCALRGPTAPT